MLRERKSKKAGYQLTDKAAQKIVRSISFLQNGFASCMTRSTNKFSARTWKLSIIVFAAAWGTLSMYFIVSAFTKHTAVFKSNRIQFVIKPVHNDSLELMEEIYQQHKK